MKPISFMRLRHLSKPEDVISKSGIKDPRRDLVVEQKYDGFKVLATRDRKDTKLYSRNGNDLTAKAPEIVRCLNRLLEPGDSVLGEMVYFVGKKQSLGNVQSILHSATAERAKRQTKELGGSLEFLAYDMLEVKGQKIHDLPWAIRRGELEDVIPARGKVRRTKQYDWKDLDKAIKDALRTGGEGVVIKFSRGKYKLRKAGQPEPWGSWWKYKVVGEKANTEDVILDGYVKREKRLAFKMYQYDPSRKKVFVGYISNLPRETEKNVARMNDLGKVAVAEISHQERFPSGKFRHPGWIRLRPDKPARSATMTKLSSNPSRPMSRAKPYNVYVVSDEGSRLRLCTFSSKDYVQPHASAFQFTIEEIRKCDGHGDCWIIGSDADLKKLLKKYPGTRIVRGSAPKSNPRNSKVKDALAAEATRYKDFDQFSKMYWDACSRGLYWYATDEKRFHIGAPEKAAIERGRFYVFCSPTLAMQGKNANKKYVAELDLTKLNPSFINIKRGSDGAEIRVTGGADFIKVNRVLETDKAKRAFKWQLSILPSSKEELRMFWEKAWKKRKQKASRAAMQRQKRAEREAKRALTQAQKEREAEERLLRKAERAAELAKKGRVSKGKAAKKRKGTVARAAAERSASKQMRARSERKIKQAKAATSGKAASKKSAPKKKSTKKKGKWKRVPVEANPGTRRVRSHYNRPGSK